MPSIHATREQNNVHLNLYIIYIVPVLEYIQNCITLSPDTAYTYMWYNCTIKNHIGAAGISSGIEFSISN